MKKLLFILLAAGMLFSCQKKDVDTSPALQDVSFNATEIIPEISREDWECKDVEPTHAYVEISDGTTTTNYSLELFTVGNGLYTQSMKLPVGSYSVTKFLLYQEGNATAGYQMGDPLDIVTHATPETDSDYENYVTAALPIPFTVTDFEKEEIDIEVLCFIDVDYLAFGFDWFEIFIIELDQICFFGDICLNGQPFEPGDFDGSEYGTGLGIDIPAIMQIIVYNDLGEDIATLSNYDEVDGLLDDGLLCIPYYNDQVYTLELYLWLPDDGGFSYQLYYTYTLDDGELIGFDISDDLIFDFVVGTCGNEGDADQTFDWLYLIIRADDLATGFYDPDLLTKWFYYNDNDDVINNSLGSFVAGPSTPPAGTGSSQVSVSGQERVCLATFQFGGVELADITTLSYSTYNPSAGNGGGANNAGFLNINVDFYGSNTFQNRLVYVPDDNGVVNQDTWQEWDAIDNGNSLWRWSGNLWGGPWPGGNLNPVDGLVSLNDIINEYPGVRILTTNPFVGIRVGNPDPSGYTENMDAFKFGTGSTYTTYDFEN